MAGHGCQTEAHPGRDDQMPNTDTAVTFVPVTKEDALTVSVVHANHGARAGKCPNWRRNGQTQTWKTRITEFRMPIKYGFRTTDQLTDLNADQFHTAATCPFGNA